MKTTRPRMGGLSFAHRPLAGSAKYEVRKMEYDIDRFAEEFEHVIDWMLADRYGKKIKDDLQLFNDNKSEFSKNPDAIKPLRTLIELIITQAWYYRMPGNFQEDIDAFITKHGTNFRTAIAQADLIKLVEKLARPRIVAQAKGSIQKFLANYSTLEEFTKQLHDLAKRGETDILGEKGRDNYLRDFGYWDRIPMDRHEMRFIIRTGIYHACSVRSKGDPLGKVSLHDALTRFSSKPLKGKVVEGIDLGNAPGIVDIFIWSYCGKERYNICGSTPKCDSCGLKSVCLYPLIQSR